MKILIVARGFPKEGGLNGIFERDQALALKAAGNEVAYAAIDLSSIRHMRKLGYQRYDYAGIEVYNMDYPIGRAPANVHHFFYMLGLKTLYKKIFEEFGEPDIVHAHFTIVGAAAVDFFKSKDVPVVITEHSSRVGRNILTNIEKKLAINAYRNADKVIAVSKLMAERIQELSGVTAITIPNMVDLGGNISLSSKEVLHEDNKFRFVSAGRIGFQKGFDLLLDAMEKLVHSFPYAELTIYGEGEYSSRLKQRIDVLGLKDVVKLYGKYKKSELPELWKDAEAFVLASRGETFGVVYIEAMILGLPVIATRCGGPEDFVTDEVGILVDVDNIDQLVNAMAKMIQERNKYRSDQIYEYVKDNFSSEVVADRIIELYGNILSEKR